MRMLSLLSGPSRAIGIALACVLAVWLAATRVVHATVVVPAGVTELAIEATAIAHGSVVRIDARQGAGRRVERLVTVQVFDYLKGGLGNVVQLQLPGGTFGRYTTIMIGAPELEEGDEVVLFLGVRDGDTLPHLLGFHQGVYRIISDPSTGERWVTPPLVQGANVQSTGQPVPVTRGDVTRRPPTLDEFRGTIDAALKANAIANANANAIANALGQTQAPAAKAGAVRRRR
jgi:hypothetical protein